PRQDYHPQLSLLDPRSSILDPRPSFPPAGGAVLPYIMEVCAGVRQALSGASLHGAWLATGPLRPGGRPGGRQAGGRFLVGDAAGEAHPVVAEGISMALQAGWLLAERLVWWGRLGRRARDLPAVTASYTAAWRRCFSPRLRASALLAHWAMRPVPVAASLPLL